jgi:predicted nucleic-acid-binding protein
MEISTQKRFKDERYIAYSVIETLKYSAIALESNDPTHKNGVKYKISKNRYEDILNNEFNRKCAKHMNRESIRKFIETKLKKL